MPLSDSLKSLRKGLSASDLTLEEFWRLVQERLILCLPMPARRILAQRDRSLILEPGTTSAQLFLMTGAVREAVGECALQGAIALPTLLTGHGSDRLHKTVLMMPREAVLTRTVRFPAQVRSNLRQVMQYELDRLSPFQAHEVVYDFMLRGGGKGADRVTVDLALCRRDRIESWIKRLAEAGSPVDRISWEGAWPHANLLPPEERPRLKRALLTLDRLLWVLVLLLLIGAMATPLWQKGTIADALDAEVKKVRAQAVTVDEVRQELERARLGSTAVLQQKWEQPRILDLLRELTDRLPDDTWVQSFDYNDGQVEVRGESGQATALIALLEEAPDIEEVSFRSPVTQVPRTGKERFNIAFRFTRPREE